MKSGDTSEENCARLSLHKRDYLDELFTFLQKSSLGSYFNKVIFEDIWRQVRTLRICNESTNLGTSPLSNPGKTEIFISIRCIHQINKINRSYTICPSYLQKQCWTKWYYPYCLWHAQPECATFPLYNIWRGRAGEPQPPFLTGSSR